MAALATLVHGQSCPVRMYIPKMASRSVFRVCRNLDKIQYESNRTLTVTRAIAAKEVDNKVTHTGQKFDENDYRMVRFVEKQKEVNPNWAIKLIDEVPPTPKKARIVACDGGGGPLGHPKVYINLDKPGNHCCGYCGLRFYKEDHH